MTRPMPEPLKHNTKTFPHVSPDDSEGSCFICYAEMNPEIWVTPKYLTDAECAAEYWRAKFDCEDYTLADGYGDGIVEPYSRVKWWMRDPVNNDRRAETWHRFATLPHALEQDTK